MKKVISRLNDFVDLCEEHYKKILYPLMLSPIFAFILYSVNGAIEAHKWECF